MKKFFLILGGFTCLGLAAKAQQFDPVKAFAQDFYPPTNNLLRSANGNPGSDYWQNKVDYQLEAVFDTATQVLKGKAVINYQNNSPDNLDFLWLALDHNVDKKDALAKMMKTPTDIADTENGFHIEKVVIDNKEIPFEIYDTRMKIKLPKALKGKGSSLNIHIDYHFKLTEKCAAGRAGILNTPDGKIYEVSYWYPRLCVYDDLRGWNTLPFIGGGEFYCEYGNFDYKITLPVGMLAVGSGELINGKELLNDKILQNITKAKKAETTTIIRSIEDVRQSPTRKNEGTVTWHFQMNNSRDVAFAFSKSFVWDGAKANLPNGQSVFVHSVYPKESLGFKDGWPRATEYLKANIEMYSNDWFIYPYPEAVNVGGGVGGMEFPGLTFDWHNPSKGSVMWLLVSHEIGHTWYPMIVGANERRYPFMDEGFNVFINIYAQDKFNKGEFAPKRDGEYAPGGGNPADEIVPVMQELQNSFHLLSAPDYMDYKHVHPLFYFKAAYGLVMLRDVILGPKRFDEAFRTFTAKWAFKHPNPYDFFRTMDNVSGEDLSWFWRGWFANNWLLHQKIKSVAYKDGKPENGALITIENKGELAMPVLISVVEDDGQDHRFTLPVTIWSRGNEWTFTAPTTHKIIKVEIDYDHQLPQVNRKDNVWEGK